MRDPRITVVLGALLVGCAHGQPGSDAYRLADVDQPPELVACAELPPTMPDHQYMRAIVVRFDVTADGRVANAGPARPVQPGWEDTTAEAVRKVKSCQFTPAIKDGKPVAVAGLWHSVATDRRQLTTRSYEE